MIVFLLLVIIAILLFGAGAVLGAFGSCIGIAAGIITATLIVAWIASALGVDAGSVLLWACGAILLLAIVGAALAPDQATPKSKAAPPKGGPPKKPATPDHVREAMERDRQLRADFNEKVKRQKDEKRR